MPTDSFDSRNYIDLTQEDGLSVAFSQRLRTNYDRVTHALRGQAEINSSTSDNVINSLVREFHNFFLPEDEKARDPHAFGTVDIKYRIKELTSIKRNIVCELKSLMANERQDPSAIAQFCADLEQLRNSSSATVWCGIIRDLIGFRIIVRSQRNKYQIYRAFRYLCDLGQTERATALFGKGSIPKLTTEPGKSWKYFNPPVMRAYYRPLVVQELHESMYGLTSGGVLLRTRRIELLPPMPSRSFNGWSPIRVTR